jgi:hypothetical protein
MKSVSSCLILLVIIGLAAAPAWPAELRLTGYVDSVFPRFHSNISQGDGDTTRNADQSLFGRTRGRMYFNIIANDNLRGVFGFELDAVWGRNPDGAAFSFDRNTDLAGNIETKWIYVDFRVPQIPVGNRTRLGGLPLYVTPLHGQTILHGDMGGGDTLLTVSDRVGVHLYYVQFEEDSAADQDRYPGSPKLGEDYATGMTLRLKPVEGLDLHLPFVYGHLHLPSNTMTSQSGPYKNMPFDTVNVATESRYYMGFDSRYRFGNASIEPTFVYLFGTRNFDGASRAQTGIGKTSYNAFMGNLQGSYTWGNLLVQGKITYVSGNKANDDINNTGIGSRADVKYFASMNNDGGPFYHEWFEIFGSSDVDGTGIDTFERMSESGGLVRYGWQQIAAAVEYQATDNLIVEGAAGGFWTAQRSGCPAVLRDGSIDGPCTANDSPETFLGEPRLNFTGNSRFLGWEVAAGLRYTIMPGLTWTPRLAYADYGGALDQNNRKAMDAWVLVNRIIYTF